MEKLITILQEYGSWSFMLIIVVYVLLLISKTSFKFTIKYDSSRKILRDYLGNVDSDKKGGK